MAAVDCLAEVRAAVRLMTEAQARTTSRKETMMTYRLRWWMWPCGVMLFVWFLTLAVPSETPLQRINSGRKSCLQLAKLPDVQEEWMWEHYPRERYVKYVQCMHDTGYTP